MGGSGLSGVDGFIISVPQDDQAEPLWMRVAGGEMIQHGVGAGWLRACGLAELPRDARMMLVVPAGLTTLHWVEFPDLPPRQGRAAARLLALDNSIGPAASLHVATAEITDGEDSHNVAVVSRAQMAHWLLWAQHQGMDPDIILPAALLLPHPGEGFVRGVVGGETVMRGPDSALSAADPFSALIIGDAQVQDIGADDINRGAIAALASPPLNLRQGDFSRRGKRALDWALMRRLAALVGVIALGSLLIALVLMMKYQFAADAVDRESMALARTVVPGVADAAGAPAQLDARLAERGGGGLAFSGPAAGVFAALRNAPDVSVASLSHASDGTLRVTLSALEAGDVEPVLVALREAGFAITVTSGQQGGRILTTITVRAL